MLLHTMKKWVKILFIILLAIWIIPSIKNTYLYFTYHHSNNALIRIEFNENSIQRRWVGLFDYFPCGIDTRIILTITFNSDSTGVYESQIFSKRVVGSYPEPYSWTALFPYDKNESFTEKHNIILNKNYFFYTKEYDVHKSTDKFIETNYFLYKISDDTLYIEYWPEKEIDNLPSAELGYNYFKKSKFISYWELINPINLPYEYSNLFKELFY